MLTAFWCSLFWLLTAWSLAFTLALLLRRHSDEDW